MRAPTVAGAVVRSPTGLIGVLLCGLLVVLALVGHRVWGDEAALIDPVDSLQGPSREHPFGTDQLGRDIFARVLAATGLSLTLALLSAGLAAAIGVPLGALAGVVGHRTRRLIERIVSISLTFPGVLVGLALVTIIGPGPEGVVIGIGVAFAPHFARSAQALATSIADSDYMAAARVVGIRRLRLLRRYVLANTGDALILQGSGILGGALVAVATFSFLGLGMQPPEFDWGRMLGEGLPSIYVAPAAALAPGAAILLAALSVNLLGEALANALDPTNRAATVRRPSGRATGGQVSRAVSIPSGGHLDPDAAPAMTGAVVVVEGLRVRYARRQGALEAVAGVDLTIARGEIVGVVGESGSGKSTVALAIAGLLGPATQVTADRLEFIGTDLVAGSRHTRGSLLGRKLAVVFQDPMSSLNPALRVGEQISEKARVHLRAGRSEARALALQGLAETHVPGAEARLRQFPHEYSGGMRQRAMIAMGLITSPSLIIADEPTTALDVTVQAQILRLLRDLNSRHGAAILLISHDIAVVTELCTRVLVMYAGRVVETIATVELPDGAVHPYTRALLATMVDLEQDPDHLLATIPGRPPALDALAPGCPFAPRCPVAVERCSVEEPPLVTDGRGAVACWVARRQPAQSPRIEERRP